MQNLFDFIFLFKNPYDKYYFELSERRLCTLPYGTLGANGILLCAAMIFNRQVYLLITLSKSLIALSKCLFTFSKYLNAFSKGLNAFSKCHLTYSFWCFPQAKWYLTFSNPSLLTHFGVFRKQNGI
ncbi:hypothetical protein [Nostoc sp.]|uniref:hypothetical protein n=1 Tax=Nostoc sp. TaxID=1180 RepID=UPI002FFAB2EA